MAYFTVLLRYIHQNPVKAGIVEHVKDYDFSSWGEYDGTVEPVFQICDTHTVLNRIPFKELEEWVNDPLGDDVQCLEIEKKVYSKPSDDQTNEQRAQSQICLNYVESRLSSRNSSLATDQGTHRRNKYHNLPTVGRRVKT